MAKTLSRFDDLEFLQAQTFAKMTKREKHESFCPQKYRASWAEYVRTNLNPFNFARIFFCDG